MKQILCFFLIFFLSFGNIFAENGSVKYQKTTKDFGWKTANPGQLLTRREFVETLFVWYPLYKNDTGKKSFPEIDPKYFKDVKMKSDFGKKLRYLVGKKAFTIQENFSPGATIDQKTFFTVMKRLGVFQNRQSCIALKICEKEMDDTFILTKSAYFRYVDKILNKNLRKTLTSPKDYWQAGYRPALSPKYVFPVLPQTLNGCYAFTVRNILKHKYNIGIRVPQVEKYIEKSPSELWYAEDTKKFNSAIGVQRSGYSHIESLFTSLAAGEPISVSYVLEYTSKGEKKTVGHIVAAYSFDEKGVWVAETYANKRVRIPYEKIFYSSGVPKRNVLQKFHFGGVKNWSEEQKNREKQYNFLVGEK